MEFIITAKNNGYYAHPINESTKDAIKVTDFTAKITKDIKLVLASGDTSHIFEISATYNNGKTIDTFLIAAERYAATDWPINKLGKAGYINTDTIAKARYRIVTHILEESNPVRITRYETPGFHKHDNTLCFIHGSDTIGSVSKKVIVEGGFSGNLINFKLPDLSNSRNARKESARALWEIAGLYGDRREKGLLLLATLIRSTLEPFRDLASFPLFIVAQTGSRKTAAALIAQATYFSGQARALGNWSSSLASLQDSLTQMNGGIFVIDDFIYKDGPKAASELEEKIEEICRNIANKTVRETRDRKSTDYYPTTIITGEHTPQNALDSLHSRIVYMDGSDIDLETLTTLQSYAKDGLLARGIADLIDYILSNRQTIQEKISRTLNTYRQHFSNECPGLHSRQPEQFATLLISMDIFTDFLERKCRFIDSGIKATLHEVNREHLVKIANRQSDITDQKSLKSLITEIILSRIDSKKLNFCKEEDAPLPSSDSINSGWINSRGQICCNEKLTPTQLLGEENLKRLNLPTETTQFYKAIDKAGLLHSTKGKENRLKSRIKIRGVQYRVYRLNITL